MKRAIATIALSVFTVGFGASVADAVPGPGNSNQCAPGQHGNDDPGFKPGACDNK
jgi:hypothetical protein